MLRSTLQPSTCHLGKVASLGGVDTASVPALLLVVEDAASTAALLPAEDVTLALLPPPATALLPLPCGLQSTKAEHHMYFVEHKASTK
jgi:hypothetical protein